MNEYELNCPNCDKQLDFAGITRDIIERSLTMNLRCSSNICLVTVVIIRMLESV